MLTFEQFQASRKEVENLQEIIGNDDVSSAGFVYDQDCYIEYASEDFRGKYFLQIERDSWVSDDLAELERTLYNEWYVHAAD